MDEPRSRYVKQSKSGSGRHAAHFLLYAGGEREGSMREKENLSGEAMEGIKLDRV